MHTARTLVAAMAVLLTAFTSVRVARAGPPEGRWLTQDEGGVVEVYRCGDAFCGRLIWFRMQSLHDNPQALDVHNPTVGLRNKPLCGLVILSGFTPDGQDQWSGGSAYDPESGRTYSGEMTLKPDGHLSLRGYIGISLFGRSEEWTPYTQPIPSCPGK